MFTEFNNLPILFSYSSTNGEEVVNNAISLVKKEIEKGERNYYNKLYYASTLMDYFSKSLATVSGDSAKTAYIEKELETAKSNYHALLEEAGKSHLETATLVFVTNDGEYVNFTVNKSDEEAAMDFVKQFSRWVYIRNLDGNEGYIKECLGLN